MESVHSHKKSKLMPIEGKVSSERTQLNQGISNSAMLATVRGGTTRPMSLALREKFEPSFKADFSNIRISRGKIPAEFQAKAFTKGTDIYLDNEADDKVLGHELAHVVQQASGRVAPGEFPLVRNTSLEHEADVLGERAAAGAQVRSGDIMNITPMSSNAAPVQAKSRAEKKMEKAAKNAGGREKLKQKRPWEITKEELEANQFNPNQDDDLQKELDEMDKQTDPKKVIQQFQRYAGNNTGQVLDKTGSDWDMGGKDTDVELVKKRTKNMMRMIRDYPELKGKIGDVKETTGSIMAATSAAGGKKSTLYWNVELQKKGKKADKEREKTRRKVQKRYLKSGSTEYTGNHELGHVLNSVLIDDENRKEGADRDWSDNLTANKIVKKAARKAHIPVKRTKQVGGRIKKGQMKLSHLYNASDPKSSHTSKYGVSDSGELFAEAFRDVYEHGKDAKPLHIEIVKTYEKEHAKREKKKATSTVAPPPTTTSTVAPPPPTPTTLRKIKRRNSI